jgi:hypothetical protein
MLTVRGPLVMCDGPLSCRCETKFTVNEIFMIDCIVFSGMYLLIVTWYRWNNRSWSYL